MFGMQRMFPAVVPRCDVLLLEVEIGRNHTFLVQCPSRQGTIRDVADERVS